MLKYYNTLLMISFLVILFNIIKSVGGPEDHASCIFQCRLRYLESWIKRLGCYDRCDQMYPY